jgi:tetratricopeptide (TPR) repeat protein
LVTWTATAGVLILLSGAPALAQHDLDARVHRAWQAAYNLDRSDALAIARQAVLDYPDDSAAHRTLAAILWLQALFLRGAVTVDHYVGGITSSSLDLPDPPESLAKDFDAAIGRAIELAEAAVADRPDDPDALYDLGAAYGLRASWVASVEGRVRGALGAARRAFNAQERVLELDPDRIGAGAVVGTYRYVVAGLGLPLRMVAYLVGFGGGKEEGIALLETAARSDSESRFEAQTALVLIYSREGRHEDAYRVLSEMSAEFPRNRILVLERGSAAIRAGMAEEAERILRDGIDTLAGDKRPRMPGELALWHYKLALAQFELKELEDASASFINALTAGPEPWVHARIELALGKIDDLEGRRVEAVGRYRRARQLARDSRDRVTADEAERLMRRPFAVSRLSPGPHRRPWHPAPGTLV